MSETAPAETKSLIDEALDKTPVIAEEAPAAETDPIAEALADITREEAAELRMLVDAERAGNDVTYAAFHSLCPTGEEFAFDDKACAVYRLLDKRGLIEGAEADGGFLFFNLTQTGRDVADAYAAAHASDAAQSKASPFAGFGARLKSLDATTIITSAVVAAIVGFLAGLLGSLVGGSF